VNSQYGDVVLEINAVGNRTSLTELNGPTLTYTYDDAYRLVSESNTLNGMPLTTTYLYDEVGNRIRETRSTGEVTRYFYNANDQLTSVLHPNYVTDNYSYDPRGNLMTVQQSVLTLASYSYDARDQLTSATVGQQSVTFAYDHMGRRVQQNVAGQTTNYLWDEFSQYGDVVRETDATGNELVHYTLANGQLISQTRGPDVDYFLADALGSTRALVDSTGTITSTFEYDAGDVHIIL
jgi:YD repeat-containing protein